MKILFFTLLSVYMSTGYALVVTGKAYRDNKLQYIEKHFPTILGDGTYSNLRTEYFDDSGKKFAEIKSDFSQDLFVPNVSFYDNRFELIENISKDKTPSKIKIEREVKTVKSVAFLNTKSASILGQGFHNFIVKNFDNILREEVDVFFIITSKADQFHFKSTGCF